MKAPSTTNRIKARISPGIPKMREIIVIKNSPISTNSLNNPRSHCSSFIEVRGLFVGCKSNLRPESPFCALTAFIDIWNLTSQEPTTDTVEIDRERFLRGILTAQDLTIDTVEIDRETVSERYSDNPRPNNRHSV